MINGSFKKSYVTSEGFIILCLNKTGLIEQKSIITIVKSRPSKCQQCQVYIALYSVLSGEL